MNAIDILGDLLGHKSEQGGLGGKILKDIFKRQRNPQPEHRRAATKPTSSSEIQRDARELEELLNVAHTHHRSDMGSESPPETRTKSSEHSGKGSHSWEKSPAPDSSRTRQNQQAECLVQAMLNAAKADGQIDRQEQETILSRIRGRKPESMAFLRKQMEEPLDLESFIRVIPLGMEKQVYAMSLIAIDLDTRGEANYLLDLASGLRLDREVCDQIHHEFGAPILGR